MNQNLAITALLIIAFIGSGFYLLHRTAAMPATAAIGDSKAAAAIFQASFADLNAESQQLAQWRGKVIVLNFWATWCPPCRAEIPGFIALQQQYGAQGVQFIGIAIDQESKVRAYAAGAGMNYPVLLGGNAGRDLLRDTGNVQGGLPYTVIVGRNGSIAATHLGQLSHEKLEAILRPLFAPL